MKLSTVFVDEHLLVFSIASLICFYLSLFALVLDHIYCTSTFLWLLLIQYLHYASLVFLVDQFTCGNWLAEQTETPGCNLCYSHLFYSAIWNSDLWSHPFFGGVFWLLVLWKLIFQQVSLPEEGVEELVAEFLDVESKVTFITSADLCTPLFLSMFHFIHCVLW